MECIDTLKDALKQCTEGKCVECPLKKDPECMSHLANRSSEYIKELEIQLTMYHKADTFLAVHGWTWGETNADSTTACIRKGKGDMDDHGRSKEGA